MTTLRLVLGFPGEILRTFACFFLSCCLCLRMGLLWVCFVQEKFLQDRIKVNGKTGNLAAGAGA